MAKNKKLSNRNLIRQEIILKDGTKKAIFHNKPTHAPQFANQKELWDWQNKMPKPNSKRQKKLREQKISILEEAA